MSRLLDNLLLFGRILRRAGMTVDPERLLDVVKALGWINLGAREEVYHACRTLLVNRQDQIAIFDRAFDAFWRAHLAQAQGERRRGEAPQTSVTIDDAAVVPPDLPSLSDEDESERVERSTDVRVKTWSDLGVLTEKDFGAFTAGEIAAARAALARLAWNPGERRTRRWIRGHGPRLDLRRAIADSIRTSGDIVRFRRRERRWRPRPLVLVCDVSGSMERYTRMLLLFAHAVATRQQRVEAFLFSTRLTRITRQLRMPRPDDALSAVSQAVTDWSGGTRIGAALKDLRQRWSRRILHGGAVVLLISDGWDRGDPAELREQVAWLQRSSHRLVWLNPLIGTLDYAPLTRGLQAALPFVDDFLPARTLTNLADLAVHLNAPA